MSQSAISQFVWKRSSPVLSHKPGDALSTSWTVKIMGGNTRSSSNLYVYFNLHIRNDFNEPIHVQYNIHGKSCIGKSPTQFEKMNGMEELKNIPAGASRMVKTPVLFKKQFYHDKHFIFSPFFFAVSYMVTPFNKRFFEPFPMYLLLDSTYPSAMETSKALTRTGSMITQKFYNTSVACSSWVFNWSKIRYIVVDGAPEIPSTRLSDMLYTFKDFESPQELLCFKRLLFDHGILLVHDTANQCYYLHYRFIDNSKLPNTQLQGLSSSSDNSSSIINFNNYTLNDNLNAVEMNDLFLTLASRTRNVIKLSFKKGVALVLRSEQCNSKLMHEEPISDICILDYILRSSIFAQQLDTMIASVGTVMKQLLLKFAHQQVLCDLTIQFM